MTVPLSNWVLFCLMLLAGIQFNEAAAAQHALVVGIDDSRFGHPAERSTRLNDLQGAANDARLIANSLRQIGVDLPDSQLLINSDATRKAFLSVWEDVLSKACLLYTSPSPRDRG